MADKTCPICSKPVEDQRFAPFCSKRCADVDLSRWLKGGYVIPGPSPELAEDAPHAPDFSEDEN